MAVTPTADLVQVDVLMGATARLPEDRVTKRSAVMELPDPPGRLEVPRVWCSRRARTGPHHSTSATTVAAGVRDPVQRRWSDGGRRHRPGNRQRGDWWRLDQGGRLVRARLGGGTCVAAPCADGTTHGGGAAKVAPSCRAADQPIGSHRLASPGRS